MKVLYFVSGIGYGDATREHANILALKKLDPKLKVLIAAYDNSYEYFKDKFDTFKIRGYRVPGTSMKFKILPFILKNAILPFFWISTAIKFRREIKKFNPDLIVSDFEPAGITASKILGKRCLMIFGYNPVLRKQFEKTSKLSFKSWAEAKYFESLYDRADYVIIPTLLGVKKHSLMYHFVNPIVRTLPGDLPNKKDLMKKFKLKKEPIIVVLGGSDFGIKLAKNIQRLAKDLNESFIVFGSHKQLDASRNFLHIKFSENFLEYLKIAKGVITLSGQKTLSECLAFKKPTLVFPIKDHVEQLMNSYALRNIALIGKGTSLRETEVQVKRFLRDLKKLQSRVDKLKLSFTGADEIAKIIFDLKKSPLKKK